MAQTLIQLYNDCLTRLHEPTNTVILDLTDGTGTSVAATTKVNIVQYLNEASNDLCRQVYPLTDTGTFTWPSAQITAGFSAFTPGTTGNVFWACRRLSWAGVALTRVNRSALENWYPNYPNDAAATPLYYYEQGEQGIAVYPPPVAQGAVTLTGFVIPPALAADSDTPIWFEADEEKLLVFYACAMAARIAMDDPTIAARMQEWMDLYNEGKQLLLSRLWRNDSFVAKSHFAPLAGK